MSEKTPKGPADFAKRSQDEDFDRAEVQATLRALREQQPDLFRREAPHQEAREHIITTAEAVQTLNAALAQLNEKYTTAYSAYQAEIKRPWGDRLIENAMMGGVDQETVQQNAARQTQERQTREEAILTSQWQEMQFLADIRDRFTRLPPSTNAMEVLADWYQQAVQAVTQAFNTHEAITQSQSVTPAQTKEAEERWKAEKRRMRALAELPEKLRGQKSFLYIS